MKARVLLFAGAAVIAVGLVGWLSVSGSPAKPQAATERAEPEPDLAPPPAPLPTPEGVVTAATATAAPATAAPATARPAPVDPVAADDRAVLTMYQNMADAVDAYGPNACPALGQAFAAFVQDGAPAVHRMVLAAKANGEDFTSAFTAAHGADVDRVKVKLQEAIQRCGTDPGLRQALAALAKMT